MRIEGRKTELKQSIWKNWRIYFEESYAIHDLRFMREKMQDVYQQESICNARTLTEESFQDVESPFPPSIFVKLAQARPYIVGRFPNLMNQLTLIRVASCFEFFLKESIEAIIRFNPERIEDRLKDKINPLKAQMGDLRSFRFTLSFLKRGPKGGGLCLDLNNPDVREDQLLEIHQTRHILVHNMGIVDEKYVAEVPMTPLKVGEERPLPDAYVNESFHALNSAVVCLLKQFLVKFCDSAGFD